MAIMYIVSWILNFLLIAIVVAIVDEGFHQRIEDHQGVAAFLIFFIPTFLEISSFYFYKKPFIYLISGLQF